MGHGLLLQAEGLTKLVEHNNRKVAEKQLEGLKTELTEMVTQDPPTPVDECLAAIKAKKAEFALADSELVKVSRAHLQVMGLGSHSRQHRPQHH